MKVAWVAGRKVFIVDIIKEKYKMLSLGGLIVLTLGVHYGWILEPIFGHVHWIHAIHGRFCYIPIVIAASWYGLRGGIAAALVISFLALPYAFGQASDVHELVSEFVEIIFYFAIAILSGAIIDRELAARRIQEEMRVQLERSHQLSIVGQIAAGVAHEIKNPLTSIQGAFEIISDDNTSPAEKVEFQGILFGEIKRIDGIVTEFLEFAKPKEIRLERLSLSELIPTSLQQIEAHVSTQNLVIRRQIEDEIILKGDKEKLHEMLLNLLFNAIQVSESGSTIDVSLKRQNFSEALITIADFGEGIEDENLDRVFDPFFTTKPEGTGLGLAVVKSIVDGHNGEIRVQSRRGQGTQVMVSLPIA